MSLTSSWVKNVLRICRQQPVIDARISGGRRSACICSIQKAEISDLPELAWLQGFLLVSSVIAAGIGTAELNRRETRNNASYVFCTFHGELEGSPMTGREAARFLTSNPWPMDLAADRSIDRDLACGLLDCCMCELELSGPVRLKLQLQLEDALRECDSLVISSINGLESRSTGPDSPEALSSYLRSWSVIAPVFPPRSGHGRSDIAFAALNEILQSRSPQMIARSICLLSANDRKAVVRELTRVASIPWPRRRRRPESEITRTAGIRREISDVLTTMAAVSDPLS